MPRRVHVDRIQTGLLRLDADQAHHLRDVLRAQPEDEVEVFDNAGARADARIQQCDGSEVVLLVETIRPAQSQTRIIVASAVPKGDRADWMVEKLSELGVSRFIPLQTARSVVHPAGKSKLERWERLAIESAKQCRRAGVMQIAELTPLSKFLASLSQAEKENLLLLSTYDGAAPLVEFLPVLRSHAETTLLIGPEGGWSEEELDVMRDLTAVSLTATILRIETAAIAAAAVILCYLKQPTP